MSSFVPYITIDSAHRIRGTPYRFSIPVRPALPAIKSVQLLSAAIPVSHFTVSQNNNRIYFSDGGPDDFFAQVAPGVYNTSNLPVAIETAFTTATNMTTLATSSFTVTAAIDTTNLIVSISSATPLALKFGSYSVGSMASYLGYSQVNTSLANTLAATGAYNLSVPPMLYISVRELPVMVRTAGQTVVPAGTNPQTVYGTFPIVLTSDSGGISFHFAETNYPARALTSIANLSQMEVSLIDPRTGADFEVRADWIMTWAVEYEGEYRT